MKAIVLLFLLAAGMTQTVHAQTPDPDFHIYLLMGQSNMAGRGVVEGKYARAGSPRVISLDREGTWEPARHPLHFDKPTVAGVGPGLSFGIEMAKATRGKKIGLVPCAVGGTSIELWVPGAFDPATKTHPYDDAVARIKLARQAGVIKGVIWHQGESDRLGEQVLRYADNLKELISRIREETGDPSLPFIMGELSPFMDNVDTLNGILHDIAREVPFTGVVTAEGMEHKGDGVHLDSPSATELGKRYTKEMVLLVR